ncbi:MAG: HD domain-containing protein [Clostridia bacterium]|nr:HD domain-containing protein [Clostridia bacterium]
MELEKRYMQHGNTSAFLHSLKVACVSYSIAKKLKLKVDEKSLIRGSLLHDYFLYDWHDKNSCHGLHGFTHAKTALENAEKEFELNDVEKDMILKHMFPLNLKPPKHKESVILCIADKIVATCETLKINIFKYDLAIIYM